MRRTGPLLPPTLVFLSGLAACAGATAREVCPPPAPCPSAAVAPPLASCPPTSTASVAEAPTVAAPAPLQPSPGGVAAWRSAMIVTLPTEGKLVIVLEGRLANEEEWGCHPPPGKVEVAQQPGRIGLRLLQPPRPGGHGGLCRATVQLMGQVTVGPLAGGEWVLDPRDATLRHVRFEGSDGRSVELR